MSDSVIAILRVIHIVFGAFFVGGMITVAFLFLPAVKGASEAGALADHLMVRARLLIVVFVAAGIIASGAGHALYRTLWAGAGYSGPAFWYAMGGHIATVAVLLVVALAWPAAHRLGALTRMLLRQDSPPTPEQNAERDRLLKRLTWVMRLSAAPLVVTVSFMAMGRYV
jgi:hypothetical protein